MFLILVIFLADEKCLSASPRPSVSCLSLCVSGSTASLVPQCPVSLSLCVSAASLVQAALSPFQSQYFVRMVEDSCKGGEHITTGTYSCYVTLPSLHTRSVNLFSLFTQDQSLLPSPSSLSIFVSPAAGNEYLIYSSSLFGDGLRE